MGLKGGVYIFIDDPNLRIEGGKALCRKLDLPFEQDPRGRLDVGALVQILADGRDVNKCCIYGPRPPPNDSLWKKYEAAAKNSEVFIFDGSKIPGFEV